MDERLDETLNAVRSGDADRVNDAIDRVKDMDPDERARLLEVGFEEFVETYGDSGDGYVRQSVVRVAEASLSGLEITFMVDEEGRVGGDAVEEPEALLDASAGFLLEAVQDDDGRVRLAAQRALKDVFRSYDALDDDETLAALETELEELADEYEGSRRDHLREASDDAAFFRQSSGERLLGALQEMADRTNDR